MEFLDDMLCAAKRLAGIGVFAVLIAACVLAVAAVVWLIRLMFPV